MINQCSCGKYDCWTCRVELVKRQGGQVVAPNGLPLVVIRWDGFLLEHEHADHPTYIRPVSVKWVGSVTDELRQEFKMIAGWDAKSDEEVRGLFHEDHALIYRDSHVALTLYEYCYYLWSTANGLSLGRHTEFLLHLDDLPEFEGRSAQKRPRSRASCSPSGLPKTQ